MKELSAQDFRVAVLRLGHRRIRDARLTTHVFLAARALGANEGFYTGDEEPHLTDKIGEIGSRWGGDFAVRRIRSAFGFLQSRKLQGWEVVHLTVYGLPLYERIQQIRQLPRNKLIVVGGQKVPRKLFDLADYNIAVTNQPHSEVSALAVFLHELFQGGELTKQVYGSMQIIPSEREKIVVRRT